MKKKVNKKKNRITFLGGSLIFFLFALLLDLGASLWIKNEQVSITMKIQETEQLIAEVKKENGILENDIASLKAPERIYEIASAAGMTKPH